MIISFGASDQIVTLLSQFGWKQKKSDIRKVHLKESTGIQGLSG